MWSFEPVTRAWYSENGLSTPRKNFGLIVHKMALYAIGGQDKKGKVLRSVEKFDPKSGSWSEVRPMNVARMAMGCLKYRDYIWVAGGMTGDKKRPVSKIVECYNSRTNEKKHRVALEPSMLGIGRSEPGNWRRRCRCRVTDTHSPTSVLSL